MKKLVIAAALFTVAACSPTKYPPVDGNMQDCAETNSCNYSDGTPK